ncbi:MAG: hypothetical protein IVW53_05115 [Chloroflexi bacterium]|nr:hypothetical protein [Chloroflexota bacterium]
MTLRTADLDVRAWRPQSFGRSHVRKVADPLIEPVWSGDRVLLVAGAIVRRLDVLAGGAHAVFFDDEGEELEGAALDAVAANLRDALRAESVILDGYLSRQPNAPRDATPGLGLTIPTTTQVMGQMLFGRRSARAARAPIPAAATPVDPDVPLAFVAVDLLAIDDDALLGIPLLERKRILDTAFDETSLLRRSPYVRPPVDSWLVAWRALGFRELAYKAANSRYTPGAPNEAWARIAIPLD